MRKLLYGFALLLGAVFLILNFWNSGESEIAEEPVDVEVSLSEPLAAPVPVATAGPVATRPRSLIATSPTPSPRTGVSLNVDGKRVAVPVSTPGGRSFNGADAPRIREFTVEDGVAVIDGDIVLGVPVGGAQSGRAQLPTLTLWPTKTIPYFIQPSLPDHGRVLDALKMFSGTDIVFVPYTDQEDVLVFQPGTGTCKSYVGKSGGKQPVWLSPGCGAHEVAHEIMHALGFTHEQNRFDRDGYIKLNRENIDPTKLTNFEKMPEEFLQASGQSDFSFDSIMIYPPTMFSTTGAPTMTSLRASEPISPSQTLSREDIDRVNKVYGSR